MRHTLTFALAVLVSASAWAQSEDSAYVAFSALDDGSCLGRSSLESLAVGYSHESENRSAHGYVRQAPSGGNCESDSITINLEIEQRFDVGMGGLDGLIKLGFDKRSVSALYGTSARRDDGQPAFAAALPAGTAETPVVVIGASYTMGNINVDLGYNPLDIDWSDGSRGGTVHLGLSAETDLGFADLETRFSMDTGQDTFGDWSIALTKDFPDSPLSIRLGYDYAFGLTSLDAGVPMTYEYQEAFSGDNALRLQGTEDASALLTFGVEFALNL